MASSCIGLHLSNAATNVAEAHPYTIAAAWPIPAAAARRRAPDAAGKAGILDSHQPQDMPIV